MAAITDAHGSYAREVAGLLRERGLRVRIDGRGESIGRKVRDAHASGIPLFVAVGQREVESRSITVRRREGTASSLPREDGAGCLVDACRPPS